MDLTGFMAGANSIVLVAMVLVCTPYYVDHCVVACKLATEVAWPLTIPGTPRYVLGGANCCVAVTGRLMCCDRLCGCMLVWWW
jgi:hypothetical protein